MSEITTGFSYTQGVSIEPTSCYVGAYVFTPSEVSSFYFKNGIVYASECDLKAKLKNSKLPLFRQQLTALECSFFFKFCSVAFGKPAAKVNQMKCKDCLLQGVLYTRAYIITVQEFCCPFWSVLPYYRQPAHAVVLRENSLIRETKHLEFGATVFIIISIEI